MIAPKSLIFIVTMLCLLACIFDSAKAQQLNCDKLNQVIKIVAADPTLASIKGAVKPDKFDKKVKYQTPIAIWEMNTGLEDQYIQYNADKKEFTYHTISLTEGSSGTEAAKFRIDELKKCLGGSWVLKIDASNAEAPVYYLKNPANYVVICVKGGEGAALLECYNDSKNNAPECLLGNCDGFFGVRHYFNEDTYSGTFLDRGFSGMGHIQWYNLKMAYQGSFIDNQVAGYGTMYYDNKVLSTGIFFKGDPVKVDTTLKTCQYGNCQTGFGLKVIAGGFYVGNFKDGLYDGLGELATNKTAFYGHFQKNQINGKGININAAGDYTFATYNNGKPIDNYEVDYADKTSKEGHIADGTTSMYNEDNIFYKGGVIKAGTFAEYNGTDYLNVMAFAKSLKEFYAYGKTNYKEIWGEQSKMLKSLGKEGYKSKQRFLNVYETNIYNDAKNQYYYTVDIFDNIADKLKGVTIYNKYYDLLVSSLGLRWAMTKNDGKADAEKSNAAIAFQNMYDKTRTIELSLDRGSVRMEVH